MGEPSPASQPLAWVPGRYAVCRLAAGAPVPRWAAEAGGRFVSITRTAGELSIVAPQDVVPADVRAERDWALLGIVGTLDFGLVGVLARLTGALADAGVPVFAVSTYETDYLLVKADRAADAAAALRASGAATVDDPPADVTGR